MPSGMIAARPRDVSGLSTAIVVGVLGYLMLLAAGSFYNIALLPLLMALGVSACVGVVVIRAPVEACAGWLLLAGTSPEYWLADIMPGDESAITAVVKLAGLALVAVCVLRYGARSDPTNPGLAFVVMFVVGVVHGLYPGSTVMDSLRSLIGSSAPYAFSFSRGSRRWCRSMIEATIWVAPVIVGFGVLLNFAGIRPLFDVVGGAARLQGSTHPAFLGGFAMTGVYASLLELYRDGRNKRLWTLVLNFVILVASGARAPLACALVVTASAFFGLRSVHFPTRRRVPLVLAGALLLPVMVGVATGGTSIRLLNVLSSEAGDLSGRDIIWPYFIAAWNASPIFGWGVGAARFVMDPDSLIVKLLGTTAAHNEYLRMGVDGGYFGLAVLIGMMALWAWRWTRRARGVDRFIMRAVFLCFAVHSFTDNTLIAATASVLFAWVSAVFARAALEREAVASAVSAAAQRQREAAQIA